jgi:hypothetical protein
MYKCLSLFLFLFLSVNCLAQTCLSSISETTASENFFDNGDGTVSDLTSGLMWMSCSLGQSWSDGSCVGDADELDWQQALQQAHGKEFAGKAGWRLPNIKELSTLSERSCVRPAINTELFPNTPSDDFWSSTPSVTDGERAWVVAFFNSSNSVKQKTLFVYARLVRNVD